MPPRETLEHIRLRRDRVSTAMVAWLEMGEKQFRLAGKTFSLGRARENNMVFTSAKVSRRHALVHAGGDAEFSLVDLGSSNGTHVNGRRVIQPVGLRDRDVIQIGEQSMTFRVETASAEDSESAFFTEQH